jgi:hypothetical protein
MLSRQFGESRSRRRIAPEVFPARPSPISLPAAVAPAGEGARGQVFKIDGWTDRLGRLASRYQRQMIGLGNLETRLFADEIEPTTIDRPIFIAGLARAGTTILLESLERHPDTVTHRYRDFPMVLTPVFWNRLLDRMPRRPAPPQERAHRDGISVTDESPEAFEEILWMAFFPTLHDAQRRDFLDADTRNPPFERFFRDHIRKLLWLRGGTRYLSKANYNLTRLEYLLRLFPDARIVIPIRDPIWHIASLIKQHRLFCRGQHEDSRALRHLQRVGHFEFGLDRRPIAADDPMIAREVAALWRDGREVEGWALYWAHVHEFVLRRLERSQRLRDATLVVRHEDLCAAPQATIERVLAHCGLAVTDEHCRALARRFHAPTYYRPTFSEPELKTILARTSGIAGRLGYFSESNRRAAVS